METFKIVDSKGEECGTLESDLDINVSNPKADGSGGGKQYISATIRFAGYAARTALYESKAAPKVVVGKLAVGNAKPRKEG